MDSDDYVDMLANAIQEALDKVGAEPPYIITGHTIEVDPDGVIIVEEAIVLDTLEGCR